MEKIEAIILGKIDPAPLEAVFGPLLTADVVVTQERMEHIQSHHPQDYALFLTHGADAVTAPDLILQDTKHEGTVFAIRHLPDTHLNVVLRLALAGDDPSHRNSVMTFYRIRERNLHKLVERFPLLYKRE